MSSDGYYETSDDYCETSDVVNSAIRYKESDSRDERSAIAAGPTLTRKAIDFKMIWTKIGDVFLTFNTIPAHNFFYQNCIVLG